MSYEPFEHCARSIRQAADTLSLLRQRRNISSAVVEEIHRRRRTADIALQACFDELSRAFITPIDREDILLLRQTAEGIACAAEDIVLVLNRLGQPTLTPDDTALLASVSAECRLLSEGFTLFPLYPRQTSVLSRLAEFEKQHRLTETLTGNAALHRFSDACFSAAQILRRVLLQMI